MKSGDAGPERMEGPAGLPRRNGELVFEEPWQSRLFGATVALHEESRFEWAEFQGRLTEEISEHPDEAYYERWLAAFERLLVESGTLTEAEIARRAGEYERQERDVLD